MSARVGMTKSLHGAASPAAAMMLDASLAQTNRLSPLGEKNTPLTFLLCVTGTSTAALAAAEAAAAEEDDEGAGARLRPPDEPSLYLHILMLIPAATAMYAP